MKSAQTPKPPDTLRKGEVWFIEPTSSNLNQELTNPEYGDPNAVTKSITCQLKNGEVVERTVFKISRHLAEIIYTKRVDYNFILYGAKKEGMMPKEAAQNFPFLRNPYDRQPPKKSARVIKGSSLLRRVNRQGRKKKRP
jgi:hypothetical protein